MQFNASGYNDKYFNQRSAAALESARVVVPVVMSLLKPGSVLDVGCARGEWLSVFREHGIEKVKGLDGEYVDQTKLLIPEHLFESVDLLQPFKVDERWDLVLCLEVAEHLFPKRAAGFVEDLTKAAPIILFSAAVPGQGGPLHLNEQWPAYWEDAFAAHRYARLDVIRPLIWQDARVNWWYQQNMFLYASPEALAESETLRSAAAAHSGPRLELISEASLHRLTSVSGILKEMPRALKRMIRRRARR